MTNSSRIISIDDTRRIVPLLLSLLMSEEECVTFVFGPTGWPRHALLLPTLFLIVSEVLEPSEPSSRQLRLSVRPLDPRASYLAGWRFTMRDRAITFKEIVENK